MSWHLFCVNSCSADMGRDHSLSQGKVLAFINDEAYTNIQKLHLQMEERDYDKFRGHAEQPHIIEFCSICQNLKRAWRWRSKGPCYEL